MGSIMLTKASRLDPAYHLEMAKRFTSASQPYHAAFHLGLARELGGVDSGRMLNADGMLDRPRTGSSATRQYYWRMYDAYIRNTAPVPRTGAKADAFRRCNYALGALPASLALRLQKAIMTAPVAQYSSAERLSGFVASNYDVSSDAIVNGHSRFRELDSTGEVLLSEALVQMRDDVASCLGTPWRVIGVKSWTTPPGKPPIGMYGWHGDDWVGELFKIMIYLTPMSRKTGSLEILENGNKIFLEAPDPGRWILFRNSDLVHRGVPGSNFERAVIEITLSRGLTFDLRLRFPGFNAHWPELPWVDVLDPSYKATVESISPVQAALPRVSLPKRIIISLVNRFAISGPLFRFRRRAERLRRLYFSFHPQ
jgi:hypothetical protein